MGAKPLPDVEGLSRRSVTYAKTKWPYLKRKVRSVGCVAITSRGKVQAVAMDASLYQKMVSLISKPKKRRR